MRERRVIAGEADHQMEEPTTEAPPAPVGEPGAEPASGAQTPRKPAEPMGLRRKTIVIAVAAMVLVASGIYLWAEYLGPRSMEDIAALVINDPTPASPGFKHGLAGDKITVKGKVTNITTVATTVGNMSKVELDHFDLIHLVFWDEIPYKVGDTIRANVRFEWSVCNDESHVYSPQLDFPTLATLPSVGVVLSAVAAVAGTVVTMAPEGDKTVLVRVFDQYPALSLAGTGCSVRVGRASFAAEYVDVLGIGSENHSYGHELDSIDDLATGASRKGNISFLDSDHDGFLSRNDTFVLMNLTRPAQESGAYTYVLILHLSEPPNGRTVNAFALSYIVMTSRGPLAISESSSPYVRLGTEVLSQTEARFTFVSVLGQMSWDQLRIMLSDGINYAYWNAAAGDLDNGPMSREDLPSVSLGLLLATCTIYDVAGNGILDEGDYFTISTWGGSSFSSSTNYTAAPIDERTNEQMGHSVFHG